MQTTHTPPILIVYILFYYQSNLGRTLAWLFHLDLLPIRDSGRNTAAIYDYNQKSSDKFN